jgi:hypothetical protein
LQLKVYNQVFCYLEEISTLHHYYIHGRGVLMFFFFCLLGVVFIGRWMEIVSPNCVVLIYNCCWMLIVNGNILSKVGSINFCRPLKLLLHWGLTTGGAVQSTACLGPTLRWDTSMRIKALGMLSLGSGNPQSSSATTITPWSESLLICYLNCRSYCMRKNWGSSDFKYKGQCLLGCDIMQSGRTSLMC